MSGAVPLRQAIRGLSDPMVLMRRVVDQAVDSFPLADGAMLELVRGNRLTLTCGSGILAEQVGRQLPLAHSLSGLALQLGETLWSADTAGDPRVNTEPCPRARAMICVPLQHDGEPIGVLKVTAPTAGAFTAGDARELGRLGPFVSATVAAASTVSRVVDGLLHDERSQGHGGRGTGAAGRGAPLVPPIDAAEFIARVLRPRLAVDIAAHQRVERALADGCVSMLGQPIVDLRTGAVVGVEALARFAALPTRPPDLWFSEADAVGLGPELQLAAVAKALDLLDALPGEAFVSINVGPDLIGSEQLLSLLAAHRPERVVLELTEHLQISDYPHLQILLSRIRSRGTRLAIDDAGAGFASLSHIVNLAPDLIKLDRQFIRGSDVDPARRALAHALVTFARDTGAGVVAEGIETAGELEAIRRLEITLGQGYFISRPASPDLLRTQYPEVLAPLAGAHRAPAPHSAAAPTGMRRVSRRDRVGARDPAPA